MCGATSCLSCADEFYLTAPNECNLCPDDKCLTCQDYDGTCEECEMRYYLDE